MLSLIPHVSTIGRPCHRNSIFIDHFLYTRHHIVVPQIRLHQFNSFNTCILKITKHLFKNWRAIPIGRVAARVNPQVAAHLDPVRIFCCNISVWQQTGEGTNCSGWFKKFASWEIKHFFVWTLNRAIRSQFTISRAIASHRRMDFRKRPEFGPERLFWLPDITEKELNEGAKARSSDSQKQMIL